MPVQPFKSKGKFGWRLRKGSLTGPIEYTRPAVFPTQAAALANAREDTLDQMDSLGIADGGTFVNVGGPAVNG